MPATAECNFLIEHSESCDLVALKGARRISRLPVFPCDISGVAKCHRLQERIYTETLLIPGLFNLIKKEHTFLRDVSQSWMCVLHKHSGLDL